MEELSSSRFAKSGTHDSLSCVDLPCSERRVVITTPPEPFQTRILSGLTKNNFVEPGDKRNEGQSSSPVAEANST
jgi:hypothetical protein